MVERIGRYELLSLLGEGGMGSVHEARHAVTGRRVAIKLLKPAFAKTENALRRFVDEARAACRVEHPHVVDVLDVDAEGEQPYMVIELLQGESLEERLEKGTLTPSQLWLIAEPLLDALHQAHQRGILHRDLKPANIFLADGADGSLHPKLLDFGIAKILGSDRESLTRTGHLLGTPLYMPPEYIGGVENPGPAGDIYSFAAVCYEALAGRPPHIGETIPKLLLAIATATPQSLELRGVPASIAAVVARGLASDPADRPASVQEFAEDFREALARAKTSEIDPTAATRVSLRAPPMAEPADAASPAEAAPPPETRSPSGERPAPAIVSEGLPMRSPFRWVALVAVLLVGAVVAWTVAGAGDSHGEERAADDEPERDDELVAEPAQQPRRPEVVPVAREPQQTADAIPEAPAEIKPAAPPRRTRRRQRAAVGSAPMEAAPVAEEPVEPAPSPPEPSAPARVPGQRTKGLGADEF